MAFDPDIQLSPWDLVPDQECIICRRIDRSSFDDDGMCNICTKEQNSYTCSVCEEPFFIDNNDVAYHCGDDLDDIDHDLDADHVPFAS
jgi:hypothetical protein